MTFTRRRFIQTSAAMTAMAGVPGAALAQTKPLPFRYAYSAISWETNIEEAIKVGQRLKMPGIEPFRQNVVNYLDKPLALKKLMDDAGLQILDDDTGEAGKSSALEIGLGPAIGIGRAVAATDSGARRDCRHRVERPI